MGHTCDRCLPRNAPGMEPMPLRFNSDPEQEAVLAFVRGTHTGKFGQGSAKWDEILAHFCMLPDEPFEPIEDAINHLIDRGILYEPTLGILTLAV